MDYISTAEFAEKWGITRRRVQMLCAQDRIPCLTKIRKLRKLRKLKNGKTGGCEKIKPGQKQL